MKTIVKIGAAVLALLLAVALALPFLLDANQFRPLLERQLSAALGRAVSIGDLSLSLLSGGIAARDLRIAEDPAFGEAPFVTAQSVSIGVDLGALLSKRTLHVRSLNIDGARVSLIQTPAGAWNFSSLGASAAQPAVVEPAGTGGPPQEPVDFAVRLIRVSGSALTLTSGQARREFDDVNLELRDWSAAAPVPFSLSLTVAGGGAMQLSGTAGPLAAAHAEQTPFDAKLEIKALDLARSGFSTAASGIGGLLSFNGEANSNGRTAAVSGAVTVDQLKLSAKDPAAARPVGINLALAHDLAARRGNIARSTLRLGSASATLAGDYDLSGPAPRLNLKLEGREMPLAELLAFLPTAGVVLPTGASIEGGTLTLEAAARGTTEALTSAGTVRIEKLRLANYDLGAKLRVVQQLAGLPTAAVTDIERATARFESSPAGTRIEDIQLVAPALGTLTGQGTVSADRRLDFRMKAAVKTGGLVAAALQQRGETTTVPFFIQGSAADPVFKADVKSIANEKLQQMMANPQGAAKNVRELVNTGKSLLDMFKKAPPKQPEQQ